VNDSASPPSSPHRDHRWPRAVYGVGTEPDPRFSFANERTFLAWIRTALGFVAAGVAVAAVAKLNDALGLEVRLAALVLVVCGLASSMAALVQWIRKKYKRLAGLKKALRSLAGCRGTRYWRCCGESSNRGGWWDATSWNWRQSPATSRRISCARS